MIARTWVVAFLPIFISTMGVLAEPPRVIKAIPDDGETDVDPGLREIRITFDQNMARDRYSFVGGRPTFPKVRGRLRWISSRTCVWSVKIEPNHKNFQNLRGEVAVPYPISFATGEGKGGGDPVEERKSSNKAAVTELRTRIDEYYSYRDLHQLDWDTLFRKYSLKMEQAKSSTAFARHAAKLLANAKDIHIWLRVDDQTIPAFRRRVVPNYHTTTLSKLVPEWRDEGSCVSVGRFADGIGYIMIKTWVRKKPDAIEPGFEALDDFVGAAGVIIDVRPNSGGSELLARQFAGCFVSKPVLYAKHVYRSVGAPGGFTAPQDRVLKPKKGRPKYRGRVAVLMGKENMSSCEAFLLMMKQVPKCKLIGETSYGSSGNPKPIDLGNDVTVFLPSWKAMLRDGTCFEGKGIVPDIPVKTNRAQLLKSDPVLEKALEFLRKP